MVKKTQVIMQEIAGKIIFSTFPYYFKVSGRISHHRV